MCFEKAAPDEKKAFIELLKLEDAQLLPYLMGEDGSDCEDMAGILQKIRMLMSARPSVISEV